MMEALGMPGYVHRMGLTGKRQEALKPKLPGDFKILPGSSFASSAGSLFGDIVDNVEQITETSKLSIQMDVAGRKHNGRDRSNSSNRGRERGFFANRRARGRGRGFHGSDRGNSFSLSPQLRQWGMLGLIRFHPCVRVFEEPNRTRGN